MARLMLDRVTKQFGQHAAVNGVTLDISPGEFVALLGPSGCGKTTMLRMLAGFEQVSSGTMTLGETLLASAHHHVPPEQRNMAMVFQSYALWPHMSVADNVGYPLKLRRIQGSDYQRRVAQALEQVALTPYAQRSPQALSGGQRQRVALARCLVTDPNVVLLDEPLANLDRNLRAAMEHSFVDFHRRTQATMVYVTHDQSEAMAMADRIAVMREGELVQWIDDEAATPAPEWLDLRGAADPEGAARAAIRAGLPLSKLGNKDAKGRLYFQTRLNAAALPEGLPSGKADNQILGVVQALKNLHPDREVVLVSKDINMRIKARALGLRPLATLVSWSVAGVPPAARTKS